MLVDPRIRLAYNKPSAFLYSASILDRSVGLLDAVAENFTIGILGVKVL